MENVRDRASEGEKAWRTALRRPFYHHIREETRTVSLARCEKMRLGSIEHALYIVLVRF